MCHCTRHQLGRQQAKRSSAGFASVRASSNSKKAVTVLITASIGLQTRAEEGKKGEQLVDKRRARQRLENANDCGLPNRAPLRTFGTAVHS